MLLLSSTSHAAVLSKLSPDRLKKKQHTPYTYL
nr:MAG TPA: hypothetical protein [Caudoviricetes sp.]